MTKKIVFANKFFIVSVVVFFFTNLIEAQPRTGKFIDVSIGYGQSFSYDDTDIYSSGFFAQGEYVFGITKWFGVRPYAGLIFTSGNESDQGFKTTANAVMLGGKARVLAPIPWVAPYMEGGIGASFGSFETFTPSTNIDDSGVFFHIPFSIGLAIGRKHNFDIAFTYYFHPSLDQATGAAAVGFSFKLK